MAKKRKLSQVRPDGPKEFDPQDGKLGPIRSYEDVADSEDEFHINRDKVLLEDGPEAKRRRKIEEEEALLALSDEEILGYSSSELEEDKDDDAEDASDYNHGDKDVDIARNHIPKKGFASGSEGDEEEEDEDAGGWGSSKRDYYDADNIETEADALEEEVEAKRLQQKKLQKMSEADFGFDENEWLDVDNDDDEGDVVTEVLKEVEITPEMSTAERLSLLQRRYPEFEALANEYLQLQPMFEALQFVTSSAKNPKTSSQKSTRIAVVKFRALAAYMGALTMYFAVLTSTAKSGTANTPAIDPLELRDHSVMESLLHCRELWIKVKGLNAAADAEPEVEEIAVTEENVPQTNGVHEEAPAPQPETKKTKKERAREKAAGEAARSRAERIRAAEEELKDLSSLILKSKKPTKAAPAKAIKQLDSDSDFGEEESLSVRAAAEKAAKKKSLRFYTSQIAQKANKRAGAGRDAGGDADIPYRERLKDRQARLNAEAEKRGKNLDEYGRGGVMLGSNENASDSDAHETELANAVRGDGDDEYYDMVAQTSRARKDEKAAQYAAIAAAKAAGATIRVPEVDELDENGKRAITYLIQKNKGLAPKRKKDVRNPRVKKRKKYEEKKKKLSSIRAVYKGGEGRGGYGGEKTGIKTGLVKSVKL